VGESLRASETALIPRCLRPGPETSQKGCSFRPTIQMSQPVIVNEGAQIEEQELWWIIFIKTFIISDLQ
jgi:hypothetical protein